MTPDQLTEAVKANAERQEAYRRAQDTKSHVAQVRLTDATLEALRKELGHG